MTVHLSSGTNRAAFFRRTTTFGFGKPAKATRHIGISVHIAISVALLAALISGCGAKTPTDRTAQTAKEKIATADDPGPAFATIQELGAAHSRSTCLFAPKNNVWSFEGSLESPFRNRLTSEGDDSSLLHADSIRLLGRHGARGAAGPLFVSVTRERGRSGEAALIWVAADGRVTIRSSAGSLKVNTGEAKLGAQSVMAADIAEVYFSAAATTSLQTLAKSAAYFDKIEHSGIAILLPEGVKIPQADAPPICGKEPLPWPLSAEEPAEKDIRALASTIHRNTNCADWTPADHKVELFTEFVIRQNKLDQLCVGGAGSDHKPLTECVGSAVRRSINQKQLGTLPPNGMFRLRIRALVSSRPAVRVLCP